MRYGKSLNSAAVIVGIAMGLMSTPSLAVPMKANISDLVDVDFGIINSLNRQAISQTICVYSSTFTNGYSVTAIGGGQGGVFSLASGSSQLPYDVLWSAAANQVNGTPLTSGAPATGFSSAATQSSCKNGPISSASLIIVINSTTLDSARAGAYTGSLQLTITPE